MCVGKTDPFHSVFLLISNPLNGKSNILSIKTNQYADVKTHNIYLCFMIEIIEFIPFPLIIFLGYIALIILCNDKYEEKKRINCKCEKDMKIHFMVINKIFKCANG